MNFTDQWLLPFIRWHVMVWIVTFLVLFMQNHYRACSYGKSSLDPDNVEIVGPLQLPCSGSTEIDNKVQSFNSDQNCGAAEMSAWFTEAEAQARNVSFLHQLVTTKILECPISLHMYCCRCARQLYVTSSNLYDCMHGSHHITSRRFSLLVLCDPNDGQASG